MALPPVPELPLNEELVILAVEAMVASTRMPLPLLPPVPFPVPTLPVNVLLVITRLNPVVLSIPIPAPKPNVLAAVAVAVLLENVLLLTVTVESAASVLYIPPPKQFPAALQALFETVTLFKVIVRSFRMPPEP